MYFLSKHDAQGVSKIMKKSYMCTIFKILPIYIICMSLLDLMQYFSQFNYWLCIFFQNMFLYYVFILGFVDLLCLSTFISHIIVAVLVRNNY